MSDKLSLRCQLQSSTNVFMKKTHPIAIRMDPEVKAKLEAFAKKDHRSLSSYVGLLLMQHVEQREAVSHKAKSNDRTPVSDGKSIRAGAL